MGTKLFAIDHKRSPRANINRISRLAIIVLGIERENFQFVIVLGVSNRFSQIDFKEALVGKLLNSQFFVVPLE